MFTNFLSEHGGIFTAGKPYGIKICCGKRRFCVFFARRSYSRGGKSAKHCLGGHALNADKILFSRVNFAAFLAANAWNIYVFHVFHRQGRHKVMANPKAGRVRIRKDNHAVFLCHSADERQSLFIIVYIKAAEFKNICIKKRGKPDSVVLPLDDYCFLNFNAALLFAHKFSLPAMKIFATASSKITSSAAPVLFIDCSADRRMSRQARSAAALYLCCDAIALSMTKSRRA